MRAFLARRSPSPAMAVAFVALLAALSGTAVALPGRNTVDSGDIKRGAVKSSDIGRGAVTSSKLRTGAVTSSKLRNGSVTGAKIRTGTITGADLANDTVTGAKINESSLGTVPRAETANTASHATTANNANTVGGHAPGNLVRVASAGVDADALVGVSGTALATTISAPSAGFLVINAGSDLFLTAAVSDVVDCFIAVDGAESLPSARTVSLGADNTEEDCTTETTVQVAAGTHTVAFEYADVGADTTVGASSLQVLFVPFGPTGALP